jgi:hypothetical protein
MSVFKITFDANQKIGKCQMENPEMENEKGPVARHFSWFYFCPSISPLGLEIND